LIELKPNDCSAQRSGEGRFSNTAGLTHGWHRASSSTLAISVQAASIGSNPYRPPFGLIAALQQNRIQRLREALGCHAFEPEQQEARVLTEECAKLAANLTAT
jgi:hypothetical protein